MNAPHTTPLSAAHMGEQARLAHLLADDRVIADIECECIKTDRQGTTWWDTRPMLSPREHAPQVIDMAQQALAYARLRGLIELHPVLPHLVRITRT